MADEFIELLNTTGSEVKTFEPLPMGWYRLCVGDHRKVISSRKGTPGLQFRFMVVEPAENIATEQGDAELDLSDRVLHSTFWITENAMQMLKKFVESCIGPMGDRSFTDCLAELEGATVVGLVEERTSSMGQQFNEITSWTTDLK